MLSRWHSLREGRNCSVPFLMLLWYRSPHYSLEALNMLSKRHFAVWQNKYWRLGSYSFQLHKRFDRIFNQNMDSWPTIRKRGNRIVTVVKSGTNCLKNGSSAMKLPMSMRDEAQAGNLVSSTCLDTPLCNLRWCTCQQNQSSLKNSQFLGDESNAFRDIWTALFF